MANSKVLEVPCTCEKKIFTNKETGESFEYLAFKVNVDGQEIPLSVPKDSKLLLKYLLSKHFD